MVQVADLRGLLQRIDDHAAGGIEAGSDFALVGIVGADRGDEVPGRTSSRVRKARRADVQVTTMSLSRADREVAWPTARRA